MNEALPGSPAGLIVRMLPPVAVVPCFPSLLGWSRLPGPRATFPARDSFMRGFIQKQRGFAVLAAAAITFIPLAPARSAPFHEKPPAAFVERVSRQLVVALAAPGPTDRAEAVSARPARVPGRLSALGLTRVRALDGAIPLSMRGSALEARATDSRLLANPF